MNEAQVIVTGNVANRPSLGTTAAGVSVANMRLGYTPRRLDRESGQWVDGQTSWVTVKCWRKLADHVAMSLNKGDPVVVKGVLQVRPFTDKDGNARLGVEVLASAVGHDLSRGVTNFMRTSRKPAGGQEGTQGEPDAGFSSLPAGEPAGANGHTAGLQGQAASGWDARRDDAAEDPDADLFDETAVVAAALHAVPDLDAGSEAGAKQEGSGQEGERQEGEDQEGEGQEREGQEAGGHVAGGPEGDGPVTRSAGDARPDDSNGPGETPAARKPAGVPGPRKPGTRQHRRAGTRDGASGVKEPSLT